MSAKSSKEKPGLVLPAFSNLKQLKVAFFFCFPSRVQSKFDIYHRDIHFDNGDFLSTAQKGTLSKCKGLDK